MVLAQDVPQREQSLRVQEASASQPNTEKDRPEYVPPPKQEQDEKAAIKAKYQKKIDSVTIPKMTLQRSKTHAQGKVLYRNPEYDSAVNALVAERNRALASVTIRESGVQVKRITLSRTASEVMRGKSRSSDYHVAYQVGVATANKELYAGQITPSQYEKRISKISTEYTKAQGRFSSRAASTAAKNLKSETTRRDTARAIASASGVALGTIGKDGKASATVGSRTVLGVDTTTQQFKSRPIPKNLPTSMLQREERVLVTTPDGRQRTFRNRENANRFIGRIEGSYMRPVQGAPVPTDSEFVGVAGGLGYFASLTKTEKEKPPRHQYLADAYEGIDKWALSARGKGGTFQSAAYDTLVSGAAGVGKLFFGTAIELDNIATQHIEPWISRTLAPKTKPLEITNERSGVLAIPYDFKRQKWKSYGEYAQGLGNYTSTYGVQDTVAGVAGEFWVGGKGTGTIIKGLSPIKIGKKAIQTPATPQTKTVPIGAPVQYKTGVSLQIPPVIKAAPAALRSASPVKADRYSQEGIRVMEGQRQVVPTTYSVGYGRAKISMVSKTGSTVQLGGVNIPKTKVTTVLTPEKFPKRGIKMAADNSPFEQRLAPQLIPYVRGIDPVGVRLAQVEKRIVDITAKGGKDRLVSKEIPKDAFSTLTGTEQTRILEATKKGQKWKDNPLDTYAGSVSQAYFMKPEYLRKLGDFDFHAKEFKTGLTMLERLDLEKKADKGRKFSELVDFEKKSIKVESTAKDPADKRTGKFLEILSEDEIDEAGKAQVIRGDTLFGKPIPARTYKVKEGRTYGRQVQILKKGESLYSLQKTDNGITVDAFSPRANKDAADFYGLAKTAQAVEKFPRGQKEELGMLAKEFKELKIKQRGLDVEQYLKHNRADADKVAITSTTAGGRQTAKIPDSVKPPVPPVQTDSSRPKIISSPSRTLRSMPGRSIRSRSVTVRRSSRTLSVGSRPTPSRATRSRTGSISVPSKSIPVKSPPSKSIPSKSIPSKSVPSKSIPVKSTGTKARPIIRPMVNTQPTSPQRTRRIKAAPLILNLRSTNKKAKDDPDKLSDFLGSSKTDDIVGLFRRKTVIYGDRKTARQITKDKKVRTRNIPRVF